MGSILGACIADKWRIFCLNPPFYLSGGPWKRTLSPDKIPTQSPSNFLG